MIRTPTWAKALIAALCVAAGGALAQSAPTYIDLQSRVQPAAGVFLVDPTSSALYPHFVCASGCSGGGGGGAITAASGALADGSSVTLGTQADTVCGTDAGTCSEIALLKRDNARLSSLIALLPTALGTGGGLKIDGSGTAVATANTVTSPTETPTVTTSSTYAANAVLGGVVSVTIPASGVIQNVTVNFASTGYVGGVDLIVLNASPTGGGYTDHAALALTGTDTPKLMGVIHASDCKLVGVATASCQALAIAGALKLPAGTTLYVIPQLLAATSANFTTSGDVTIDWGVVQ